MSTRFWVLGASDPEMAAIEKLLGEAGESWGYATCGGSRVHPGNAYKADGVSQSGLEGADEVILVECELPGWFGGDPAPAVRRCDHHRPGDPGYGKGPGEFLAASSIGQIIAIFAKGRTAAGHAVDFITIGNGKGSPGDMAYFPEEVGWYVLFKATSDDDSVWARVLDSVVLTAAADHCLAAAYRGECPGVDPDELMRWRAETRAAFQRRPVGEVLADIEAARVCLQAPDRWLKPAPMTLADAKAGGCLAADLRGESVPELPEAAAREGIPFLATVRDKDGREKVVLQAAPPELVRRFLAGEIVPGLVDTYGDPARGLAGGYLS